MNKFEIYLTDLENFGKKEKKAKIKAESFGNVNRYLLGMRFFLHTFMSLKELLLGWQKKILTAVDQERRLKGTKRSC